MFYKPSTFRDCSLYNNLSTRKGAVHASAIVLLKKRIWIWSNDKDQGFLRVVTMTIIKCMIKCFLTSHISILNYSRYSKGRVRKEDSAIMDKNEL